MFYAVEGNNGLTNVDPLIPAAERESMADGVTCSQFNENNQEKKGFREHHKSKLKKKKRR